jgi:hypothetical protein
MVGYGPVNKVGEFFKKRVAGIPMLYIVVVGVGIFALVAWKLKAATPAVDPAATDPAATDAGATDTTGVTTGDLAGSVYDSLKTAGTVVVAPSTDTVTTPETVKTNATWISDGVAWLIAQDKATGTAANSALSKYVQGQDRSYDEQYLVDLWYRQGGPPPDGVEPAGTIGAKPAQKQGNPPLAHEVKGSSDNSYGDVAMLYYGHNEQATYDLVQAANPQLGLTGPFAVGTKINVPVYHVPKNYVLPYDMTASQIAGKNGITAYQFSALNNTSKTQFKKGNTVRVS